MKKMLGLGFALLIALSLVSCGSNKTATEEQKHAAAPDLSGEWKQVNSNSKDNYQVATIQGDTIEIYWFKASPIQSLFIGQEHSLLLQRQMSRTLGIL